MPPAGKGVMSCTLTFAVPRYSSNVPSLLKSAQNATYSNEPGEQRSPLYPDGCFTWTTAPRLSRVGLRPVHVTCSKSTFAVSLFNAAMIAAQSIFSDAMSLTEYCGANALAFGAIRGWNAPKTVRCDGTFARWCASRRA